MAILVDTNLLLRSVQPDHPMHMQAIPALSGLMRRKERLVVSIQNIAEFWNVATRPEAHNGLGFSIEEAGYEILTMEQFFEVLHENEASYTVWKSLITRHQVSGVQVHDARLVSVMLAFGIRQILTFDTGDFARYADIDSLHPAELS